MHKEQAVLHKKKNEWKLNKLREMPGRPHLLLKGRGPSARYGSNRGFRGKRLNVRGKKHIHLLEPVSMHYL